MPLSVVMHMFQGTDSSVDTETLKYCAMEKGLTGDKLIIDKLEFMDDYSAAFRFKQLKKENANLKRQLTIQKKRSEGNQANSQPANCAIFDVSNLTIIGLLKLMNEYNKKTEQKIAIGFHSDGVGDICDFSHDVEILIKDFDTLNEAIKFLCE